MAANGKGSDVMGYVEFVMPTGQIVKFGDDQPSRSLRHCDYCEQLQPIEGGKSITVIGDDFGQTSDEVMWICGKCNGR